MAASNYQACIAFTLKWEGGKSNDPHDPGGRTMEGVTQRRYDEFRDAKQLSRRTVFQMMPAERNEIYRSGYWEPVNGDALTAGVDLTLFDYAFNSGPARALRAWRLAKANGAPAEAIIRKLCGERLSFLHSLGNWRYFRCRMGSSRCHMRGAGNQDGLRQGGTRSPRQESPRGYEPLDEAHCQCRRRRYRRSRC